MKLLTWTCELLKQIINPMNFNHIQNPFSEILLGLKPGLGVSKIQVNNFASDLLTWHYARSFCHAVKLTT